MSWTVYILECADHTLYTGIAKNVDRRFEEHQSGVGAKYTRGRTPVKLLYTESCKTMSAALKREREIKALNKAAKQDLIASAA